MLCGYTLDALVNARTHLFLPRRKVNQFLSSFERLQHPEDVAVILGEVRDCLPSRVVPTPSNESGCIRGAHAGLTVCKFLHIAN
jgi:hypothetical protein